MRVRWQGRYDRCIMGGLGMDGRVSRDTRVAVRYPTFARTDMYNAPRLLSKLRNPNVSSKCLRGPPRFHISGVSSLLIGINREESPRRPRRTRCCHRHRCTPARHICGCVQSRFHISCVSSPSFTALMYRLRVCGWPLSNVCVIAGPR